MAIIFNIQRFSIQDGPGIRTTIFMKGCPLQCLWCSNPESQNFYPEIGHSNLLCKKCGRCIEVCDNKAIFKNENNEIIINREVCTNCGKCVNVCIYSAYKFYGKDVQIEEVIDEIVRDKPFYGNSGGGVTVSGGEPLYQPSFVAELFKRCQDIGIHTCLYTSGYADQEAWELVLPYTNLVLFDIKLIDSMDHLRATGKSNEKNSTSLELVAASEIPIIIRIPIIPGITDTKTNIENTVKNISNVNSINNIDILPYHRLGETKYSMLGRKYKLSHLRPPEHDWIQAIAAIFESFGFNCDIIA